LLSFLMLLLLPACARQPEVAAFGLLQEGVDALEAGEYALSLAACRESAAALSDNRFALRCWLVSALNLGDWSEAYEAAVQLRRVVPDDNWLLAAEIELARRTNRGEMFKLPLYSPELAWACMGGSCKLPEPVENGEEEGENQGKSAWAALPPLYQALLQVGDRNPKRAISTLSKLSERGESTDLLLLLLFETGQYERLGKWFAQGCERLPRRGRVLAQLALFLGHDSLFSSGRCQPDKTWSRGLSLPASQLFPPRMPSDDRERARLWEGAASHASSSAVFRLNAGISLLKLQQLDRAVFHLSQAAKLGDDRTVPLMYLYLAYLLQGDMEQAETSLEQLRPDLTPEWLSWLKHLALKPGAGSP